VKQASGPSLYETFAVDAYSSPKKVPHFAQYVDMPKPDEDFGVWKPWNPEQLKPPHNRTRTKLRTVHTQVSAKGNTKQSRKIGSK